MVYSEMTIRNTVTGQSVFLDFRRSGYVLDPDGVDLGEVSGSHQSYKFVNQIGEHAVSSTLQSRDIPSIAGWVIGETEEEIASRKAVLNAMINPQHLLDIIVGDYKLEGYPLTSIRWGKTEQTNNEAFCRFMFSAWCPDPLFKSTAPTQVDGAEILPKFRFPLVFPQGKGIIMGLRATSLIINILNLGSVPTGMQILFRAVDGVDSPSFTDANTNETIKINKFMEAGETILVDTRSGQRRVIGSLGGVESNYFKYRDLDSGWPQLAVGENSYSYNATAGRESLEIEILYETRLLEVNS